MCLNWFADREWKWPCIVMLLESKPGSKGLPSGIHVLKGELPACEKKLKSFRFLPGDSEGQAGIRRKAFYQRPFRNTRKRDSCVY